MSLREAASAGAVAAHEETVTGVGHAHLLRIKDRVEALLAATEQRPE